MTPTPGHVVVKGWAGDPDTGSDGNQRVHFYVDGRGVEAVSTGLNRADVAAQHPDLGSSTGFSTTFRVAPGRHEVCAYAVNQGPGMNITLGCRTVAVPPPGKPPIGLVDNVFGSQYSATNIEVVGWVGDPDDKAGPKDLRITVDGKNAAIWTDFSDLDVERPDVQKAHPALGGTTGFDVSVINAARGEKEVCVYAVDRQGGPEVALGCKTRVIKNPARLRGHIDQIVVDPADPGKRLVSGWVMAPDDAVSPTPFALVAKDPRPDGGDDHYFVGGLTAGLPRADVDRTYPANGKNHGFRLRFDAADVNWRAGDTVCIGIQPMTAADSLPRASTSACVQYRG